MSLFIKKIRSTRAIVVIATFFALFAYIHIASADTVYTGYVNRDNGIVPSGQIRTGTGVPPVHALGLQFYNGETSGNVSELIFYVNAVNGHPLDRLYGVIWKYDAGKLTTIATSTNYITGDSYDGDPNHPTFTSFTFSPLVPLDPHVVYMMGVRAVNIASTSFVLYGNNDPALMPSLDFASCTKNSGVELKVTGALGYITDTGVVGWKSCGYLVVGNVLGKSLPMGTVTTFVSQGIINRGFEGYAPIGIVGTTSISQDIVGTAFNTHENFGGTTGVSDGVSIADKANPNSESFRLSVCDGPSVASLQSKLAESWKAKNLVPSDKTKDLNITTLTDRINSITSGDTNYVGCDFKAVFTQINHLITIMIIAGVFVALIGFAYMGYLFISGTEENRKLAYSIFPKIFWGFIIMLSAWFLVYQVISWLGNNPAASSLLTGI